MIYLSLPKHQDNLFLYYLIKPVKNNYFFEPHTAKRRQKKSDRDIILADLVSHKQHSKRAIVGQSRPNRKKNTATRFKWRSNLKLENFIQSAQNKHNIHIYCRRIILSLYKYIIKEFKSQGIILLISFTSHNTFHLFYSCM